MLLVARAVSSKCSPYPTFLTKTHMDSPPKTFNVCSFSRSSSLSAQREKDGGDAPSISLQEWQAWGTNSPLPALVLEIAEDLKDLERDVDAHMSFGGIGGKLQGDFKVVEDKKHRATYQALGDSEEKLQFFAARQIACRLLGSRDYLCQKCWLPREDCMCTKVTPCSLWHGIRFWVYMHPKDFLRQNNTGKLLWQVFGIQAATLCLFGISEHEEIMWNAFKLAGKDRVWCLYPNKNAPTQSVHDTFSKHSFSDPDCNLNM
ncbi:DTW domain-containing protein, partial [Actinidia chinensis var. chinensis]